MQFTLIVDSTTGVALRLAEKYGFLIHSAEFKPAVALTILEADGEWESAERWTNEHSKSTGGKGKIIKVRTGFRRFPSRIVERNFAVHTHKGLGGGGTRQFAVERGIAECSLHLPRRRGHGAD